MTLKVIKGHRRPFQLNSFQHINFLTNIMKMHIFLKMRQGHFYVKQRLLVFFTLRSSDLLTTMTYVLMNNFYPFFSMYMYIYYHNCFYFLICNELINSIFKFYIKDICLFRVYCYCVLFILISMDMMVHNHSKKV